MPHFCGRCEDTTYMIYPVDAETAKDLADKGIIVSNGRLCADCHSVVTLVLRGYTEQAAIAYLQELREQHTKE